jgi:hypothetical protein|tara:strand:- start:2885 stop:3202 length:318 start_codon:yes stop_codon:yes gene_type:complete
MASLKNDIKAIREYVLANTDPSVTSEIEKQLLIMEKVDGMVESDRFKEAQKLLCWGNLAYCCSIKKECPWLLAVLKTGDISPHTYTRLKEGVDWEVAARNGRKKS